MDEVGADEDAAAATPVDEGLEGGFGAGEEAGDAGVAVVADGGDDTTEEPGADVRVLVAFHGELAGPTPLVWLLRIFLYAWAQQSGSVTTPTGPRDGARFRASNGVPPVVQDRQLPI